MRVTIPAAPKPKKRGGPDFHKPDCQCIACKARRRKAETLAIAARQADGPPSPPDASLSDIVVVDHKTMKGRVASWARFKATEPDITNKDIADRLGISINTLNACLTKGKKEGWLAFEDPMNAIQYEMIPRNVEQMQALMEAGDQKAILSVFKELTAPAYRDSQGIASGKGDNMMIAIKIEMPEHMPVVKGVIIGNGRAMKAIDGEVIDE